MEHLPPAHSPIPTPKTGILLLNLGTPEAPTTRAVRRYLAEFLSDTRVIDAPRWFWLPLLHGIILNTRPRKSAHAYAQIWNHAQNESPLKTYTRNLTEKLRAALNAADGTRGAPTGATTQRSEVRGDESRSEKGRRDAPLGERSEPDNLLVTHAMRYGQPSTADAITSLTAQGCTRIIALALYPQYSATTTASAYDALFAALKPLKYQPAVTTLGPYHDHPLYIEALANSVRSYIAPKGTPDAPRERPRSEGGERSEGRRDAPLVSASELEIISSFHGLPKRYFREGDPYHCHCQKTSRLLREALNWPAERWHTSFQSRFGPAKWLEPYTRDTLLKLAAAGKKHVLLLSPGFAVDCLETLEELNIGLREEFLEAGGESLTYIPCLNDTDAHVALLKSLLAPSLP